MPRQNGKPPSRFGTAAFTGGIRTSPHRSAGSGPTLDPNSPHVRQFLDSFEIMDLGLLAVSKRKAEAEAKRKAEERRAEEARIVAERKLEQDRLAAEKAVAEQARQTAEANAAAFRASSRHELVADPLKKCKG
ncbi:MAG: hypothetical protein K8U57_08500 [Planctomycetes bacterium]|nr:hypothetical protein [Planctomycetota bacterium]